MDHHEHNSFRTEARYEFLTSNKIMYNKKLSADKKHDGKKNLNLLNFIHDWADLLGQRIF